MDVAVAQLPGPTESDDRVFVTDNAVIVLDGASAFRAVPVSASEFVDTLGRHLVHGLDLTPEAELADLLAQAINRTAATLALTPGDSPSSTVAICRYRRSDMSVDLLVLGDTQIASSVGLLRDDRMASVGKTQRSAYQSRLATGSGFDEEHRRLLRALQTEQLRHRNRPGGYWIAEAEPGAASKAMTRSAPLLDLPWCVIATDGAYVPMELHEMDDWEEIANFDAPGLSDLLARCQRLEARDPNGRAMNRAKLHDDKSLAAAVIR